MNTKQVKKLFSKYVNDKCSKEEIQLLDTFLDSYQEKNTTWSDMKVGKEDAFRKVSWARIKSQINNDQKKKGYPFVHYLKYAAAASIILIVSLTAYLDKGSKIEIKEPILVNTGIPHGVDKATLTLGDGSQVVLEEGDTFQTQNANSNGEGIIYKKGNKKTKKLEYNVLTIPRGGQYFIELSDGTQVWLNSESQLKYPVNFIEGKTRQVELVYGEAYFDVSPSTQHHGADFKVYNNRQEIHVLGTEFNIKAYRDETNIYTTLVEGRVDVTTKNGKQSLVPNQQIILDLNTDVSVIKNIDVYNEISWKDGVFSFEDKSLINILKVLSRWYDVEFVVKNKKVEEQEFVGILDKDQNMEDILISIKNFGIIKKCKINEKEIILE